MSYFKKLIDFLVPKDDEVLDKWKKENGHAKSKNLTIEDFERAKQSRRNKNKTLSSNF
tara:strand:+ start:5091 stop:5264 length:174 start_codon:yes stop_codon:yes gene_type:complete